MNEYQYADIEVGHEEFFTVTIDKDKMDMFRFITGDTTLRPSELIPTIRYLLSDESTEISGENILLQ